MKLKFKKWPFPKGMPAHLYWFRSPKRVGESKQWVVEGLFIGENTNPFQFSESWGTLPLLKLGAVYVDGYISDLPSTGVEVEIKLSEHVECKVVSSCERINCDWLDGVREHNEKYLWERCVRIMDGEECLLVVPCLEVARTFYAINAKMSHLLLEPGGLESICTAEMEGKQVKIDFNEEIALNMLNDALVARIATILYQSEWSNCWKQVWSQSITKRDDSTAFTKIFCSPPISKNSNWRVRGIPTEDGFFVLQILGVQTQTDSPFSEIIWTHPNLTTSEGDSSPKPDGGRTGSVNPNEPGRGDGEIDPDLIDPKGLTKPNLMPIDIAEIKFGNSIKVIKKRVHREPKPGGQKRETAPPTGAPDTVNPVRVTLADEGRSGTVESADFLPIDQLINVPPELAKFIEAVGKVNNANVGCVIRPVPRDAKLSKIYSGQLHYALVHIVIRKSARYVLEIEALSGHGISTLVFSPVNVNTGLETAEKLLTECVTTSGNWDLDAINEKISGRFELVKHSKNKEAKHWCNRLLAAFNALGRNEVGC